ncbi:MAG: hypothetical protein ACHP7K_00140 [Actinomycetales bacterium]
MANGLYLGGLSLPYLSSLRIFLPETNFTAMEMRYIEEALERNRDRVSTDAQELMDSFGRITRASGDPMPTAAVERVRTFRWGEESPLLYCPSQHVLRSVDASGAFATGRTRQLASLSLRAEDVARLHERRAADPRTSGAVLTRTANWGIPFTWFVLVDEGDRTEVLRSSGRILTVRIQVPYPVAYERLSAAKELLGRAAPELDLFEEIEEMDEWLEGLPADAAMELDYGPVANRLYPDDSPSDVRMGLECLAEGDSTGAAAAYRRLASRWMPVRQLSRSS